jgi:hypothetical protein
VAVVVAPEPEVHESGEPGDGEQRRASAQSIQRRPVAAAATTAQARGTPRIHGMNRSSGIESGTIRFIPM